jgi:hypothetical protein
MEDDDEAVVVHHRPAGVGEPKDAIALAADDFHIEEDAAFGASTPVHIAGQEHGMKTLARSESKNGHSATVLKQAFLGVSWLFLNQSDPEKR